ncbi:hypothetical protein BC936DRAFT_139907 [Jimgerdemannia flammicorona]|uniref:Uncharacterized protein n=1 Tax=Jimgerdemannia flammicorona TaxID=994334 RepID=A0A433B928_9FUNG|nr:hypothetical protein BC936DRAFT_139907 [Jimgerdemannia flammicorona]
MSNYPGKLRELRSTLIHNSLYHPSDLLLLCPRPCPEVKDSYFIRKSTEWDIIGFLDESKEGSFEQKLDSYIKSLKTIANTE